MTRTTTITTVLEEIYNTVETWINTEISNDGILGDVEDFITTLQNERPLTTPSIWMQKHNWQPVKSESINKHSMITVEFPIEFDCIEYSNDLEEGEQRANNLVGRVIDSILKHYTRRSIKGLFKFVGFEVKEGYPNGNLKVNGKQEVIPVAGVLVLFKVQFVWNNCLVSIIDEDNTMNESVIDITQESVSIDDSDSSKSISDIESIIFKNNVLEQKE